MEQENGQIEALKKQLEQLGCTAYEAAQAAKKAARMDEALKRGLEQWLLDGTIPSQVYDGYTIEELTEQRGFTVPGAFLFLDWLGREPKAAQEALAAMTDQFLLPGTR